MTQKEKHEELLMYIPYNKEFSYPEPHNRYYHWDDVLEAMRQAAPEETTSFSDEYKLFRQKVEDGISQILKEKNIEELELKQEQQHVIFNHDEFSKKEYAHIAKRITPGIVIDNIGNRFYLRALSIEKLCDIADNI